MTDSSAADSVPATPFARVLRGCEILLQAVVAIDLAFLMFLTFFDVVGRELLTAPVSGAFEMTEIAMGILIFSAMPLLFAREQHVTVDLLDRMYRGRARQIRAVLVNLFGAVVVGAMAWRLYDQAVRYADIGEETMIMSLPLAPIVYVLFALAVAATAAMAGRAVLHLRRPDLSRKSASMPS